MSWLPVSSGTASVLRPSSLDCLSCDPYKELLWTGSADGAITCLYPHSIERRVRVQAHERGSPVLALAPFAQGVLSASRGGVRMHSRGGVLLTAFDTAGFITDITAASPSVMQGDASFLPAEILLAGWSVDGPSEAESAAADAHPTVALMDLVTNACVMSRATESASACVATGRVLACGGMDPGSALSLFDTRDFSPVRSLPGHSGGSRRLIIKGDRLVSIGYTVPPSAGSLDGSILASAGRADQLVKIYDLRTFRALPPLLFSLGGGPADAAFLPNFSSTLLVAGVTGVWQMVDAEAGLPDAHAYQVEMSAEPLTGLRASIAAMTMSSTGDLLFFGDSAGGVHQWTDKSDQIVHGLDELRINAFSAPVDWVPAGTHSMAPVQMDEHSALTTLPLPPSIDAATLISALPPRDMIATFPPPSMPPLDDKLLHMVSKPQSACIFARSKVCVRALLSSHRPHSSCYFRFSGRQNYQVKFVNGIQIVNLAAAHHHASLGAGLGLGAGRMGGAGKGLLAIKEGRADTAVEEESRGVGAFLPNHLPTLMKFAGKGRKVDRLHQKKSLLRAAGLTSSAVSSGALEEYSQVRGAGSYIALQRDALISKEYARVTIKIPRFGLYAFDFSSYNKTHFTGLDNLLPNSYVNPVLQLLYFLPRIRTTMLAHVCEREYCLTCELGFLFHMMDHGGQRGRPHTAEPRNFLRSLKQLPEAGGLGLLDLDEPLTAKGASAKDKVGNGADDDLFLAAKIQDFMRFLLEQLAKEERDSPAFQGRLHNVQNQRAQVQYSFQMNQQRRLRNFNLAAQQLQQSFASLQSHILPPNGSASPAMEASVTQSLRHQLNQFLNQSQMLFDETERYEAEQLQQQLAASAAEQAEGSPTSPRSNGNGAGSMPQTTIERVFGSVMQQRTFCHGTAQSFGSSSQPQHQAHESIQDKPTLYFKLNAYPLHETDLTFDGLLTNSLRDNSGSGSVAAPSSAGGSTPSWLGGGGSESGSGGGSAGLSTQRLFCNSCSTFTIQSSEKSLKPASAGTTPGALASAAASGSFTASNPGPLSHFPNALTIMANVTTDMEWEWWKRRDERFARTLANRKKMGGGNSAGAGTGGGAQQNATGGSSASTAKPTNLYGRFMAAAGDDSTTSIDQQTQQQPQPAAPGVVFRAGVVNAGAASSSATSSSSSSASTLPAPPTIAPIPQLSDDQLDALDVHFLPHFLLLLIDTHSNPHSPQTRSFRLLPSYARQLAAAINDLREMQATHIASQQSLSQSLVATQLLVCQLQSQLLALSQQNFFVQSKLNFAVNQHANLMHAMHAMTQQANQAMAQQQAQGGGGGAGLPPALQQRLHTMQSNLTHLQNQTHQLNAQKMQIQQSVHALQTTGLVGAVSTATAGAPQTAASGSSATGLAALQRKAQEIQAQIQAAAHQYLLRISEGESELRKMIIAQLGSATQSSSRGGAGGGASSAYAANHTATFSPSLVSHLTLSDVAVYELTAVVSAIADPPEKYSPLHSINGEHLVAHIKVDRAVYDQVGVDAAARDALRLVRQVSPNAAVSTTPVSDRSRYGAATQHASVAPSPHSPTTLPAAVSADAHDGSWFVFNDFVIRPSNGFEATRFNYLWKQPCAVVYKLLTGAPASPSAPTSSLSPPPALRSPGGHPLSPHSLHMHQQHQYLLASPFMNEALVYQTPPSLSTAGGGVGGVVAAAGGGSRFRHGGGPGGAGANLSPAPLSFQPLVPRGPHAEVMDSSSLVAIDCEFVSVQHELTDVDEVTGENVVVRPARLSLARVSVVRGSGPMMGQRTLSTYASAHSALVERSLVCVCLFCVAQSFCRFVLLFQVSPSSTTTSPATSPWSTTSPNTPALSPAI